MVKGWLQTTAYITTENNNTVNEYYERKLQIQIRHETTRTNNAKTKKQNQLIKT